MSYCRCGEGSDVYMYPSGRGIECCGCMLPGDDYKTFTAAQDALAHLQEHQDAGHEVPEHAFERLRREIDTAKEPTNAS